MKFESKKVFFRIILTKGCITKTQEETIPPKAKKLKENVLTKETVRKIIKISINGVNAFVIKLIQRPTNETMHITALYRIGIWTLFLSYNIPIINGTVQPTKLYLIYNKVKSVEYNA